MNSESGHLVKLLTMFLLILTTVCTVSEAERRIIQGKYPVSWTGTISWTDPVSRYFTVHEEKTWIKPERF
jgi:hypothetical protein